MREITRQVRSKRKAHNLGPLKASATTSKRRWTFCRMPVCGHPCYMLQNDDDAGGKQRDDCGGNLLFLFDAATMQKKWEVDKSKPLW